MESSALNRVLHNKCISQLLYSNNSIISNQIDFNSIINDEIDYLSHNNSSSKDTKSRRVDSYAILIKYFTYRQHSHLHKLIDRLPILIEVATTGCSTERRLMIQLMEVLLNDRNSDVVNLFSNVLSKLISVIHRICNRPTTTVKGIYKDCTLHVLLLLGKSNIRPMLTPHVKTIRQICFDFISSITLTAVSNTNNHNGSNYIKDGDNDDDDDDQFKLVASVFAVYVSMESSESWSSTWSQLCSDGLTMLVMLGIVKQPPHQAGTGTVDVDRARDRDSSSMMSHEQLVLIKSPVLVSSLRGLKKAVVMHEAFKAICSVLRQMLAYGCSTGLVSLDMSVILTIERMLLGTTLRLSLDDPLVYIEGEQDVSPFELGLILSSLKMSILGVVLRLLQINHPAIKRVGSGLMKPILALIVKKELILIPQLLKLTLQCISSGVRSLSCVMISSLNGSVCDFVLDRLAWEVDILTHNPLLLSKSMMMMDSSNSSSKNGGKKNNKRESKRNGSSGSGGGNQAVQSKGGHSTNRSSSDYNQGMNNNSSSNSNNNCNDDRAAAAILYCSEASRCRWLGILFETSETILVNCRHMLSSTVRERYSSIIRQGLMSLSLGIVPSLYYDRHMQRQACAPIRSDVIIQSLLIQLATAEVFIPNSKQQYSQNLALLQKTAELCMHSTATAPAASKALMIISTLLQPTTVALPAIPFMDQARDFILQSNQQSSRSHDDRVINSSGSRSGGGGSGGSIAEPVDVDVDETMQSKRQKTAEVTNDHQKEVMMALDHDEVEVEMADHKGADNAVENELSSLQTKMMSNLHTNDSSDGNQIVRVDDQVLKIYASNDSDGIHPSCTGTDVIGSIVAKHLVQQEILDNDDDDGDDDDDDDSLPDIDIDADPDVN